MTRKFESLAVPVLEIERPPPACETLSLWILTQSPFTALVPNLKSPLREVQWTGISSSATSSRSSVFSVSSHMNEKALA